MYEQFTPKRPGPKNQPVEPRFWAFVDKTPDGCWMWCGHVMRNGYGTISIEGYPHLAHRVSWEIHYGPIPEGKHVCHNCPGGDNRDCVNPDHLWLGTNEENREDSVAKGSQAKGVWINAVKGTDCHSAALTEDDVREIRRALADGETAESISARYPVSRMSISKIKRRITWKHVE